MPLHHANVMGARQHNVDVRGYLAALLVIPIAALCMLAPYSYRWHGSLIPGWWHPRMFLPSGLGPRALFFAVVMLGLLVHELLHGVGYALLGRVPWRAVSFRVHWKLLAVSTGTRMQLTPRDHRVSLMLPVIVLGVLPGAAGIWLGSAQVTVFGYIMTIMASADFLALYRSYTRVNHGPAPAASPQGPAQRGGRGVETGGPRRTADSGGGRVLE